MCQSCRQRKPKSELIRIVRDEKGELSLDLPQKAEGRGAYLCREIGCLEKAKKKGSLQRAFQSPVPPQLFEELMGEIG